MVRPSLPMPRQDRVERVDVARQRDPQRPRHRPGVAATAAAGTAGVVGPDARASGENARKGDGDCRGPRDARLASMRGWPRGEHNPFESRYRSSGPLPLLAGGSGSRYGRKLRVLGARAAGEALYCRSPPRRVGLCVTTGRPVRRDNDLRGRNPTRSPRAAGRADVRAPQGDLGCAEGTLWVCERPVDIRSIALFHLWVREWGQQTKDSLLDRRPRQGVLLEALGSRRRPSLI